MRHVCLAFLFSTLPVLFAIAQDRDTLDVSQMRRDAEQALQNRPELSYMITDVKERNGIFTITYDLFASDEFEYTVEILFRRESDVFFQIKPKAVTGAIGTGSFAGRSKTIIWDRKKDIPRDLSGDDFYFVLDIHRVEPSSFPWVWVGVGAAALIGGTVFFLSKEQTETPSPTEIPALTVTRPN